MTAGTLYWIAAAVSALLLLLIWIGNKTTDADNNTKKSFSRLSLWCIFFCLQDTLWGMCFAGLIRNTALLFITSSVFHISAVITTFFWVKYVLAFLGKHDREGKLLLAFDGVVIGLELILVIANIFTPLLFSVSDGEFRTEYLRQLTLINQFVVYLLTGIIILSSAIRETEERRIRSLTVFGFTMIPILFGIPQMLYSDGPFYSIGYCIGCFVIYTFIIAKDREKAASEQAAQMAEIRKLNEDARNKLSIIKSVIKVYFAAYYVDIEKDIYTELSSIENIKVHGYASQGKAQESLFTMCSVLIHPEFVDAMKEFVDLSTLDERLKDTDTVTIQYIGNTTGWSQAFFIAGDRREDGTVKTVIWGARTIHEEKEKELAQLKLVEDEREKVLAANAAKTTFLFNMSHDIRTPMNAIMGFTDLIEKHYDDREKCMDYLHKTQKANKLLLSLINNVLEMARIESGKEQLDETVCRTGVVTHEMISIFEDRMRQKNITFTSHVDIRTPYMLCDQPKLREICLNILSNAVKYTPEGGSISVTMEELPCERPGYARIRGVCADTGIGMSKEFLPHLFEEFTRARTATESRQQGTGLGMPIVKKLIDLMGGTIEVESEPGKGTAFTVTIDLKIMDTAPEAKPEHEDGSAHEDYSGRRILLAEDNDLNAEIAAEILSDIGFAAERAADGVICVDMLQKAECGYYDLILMDIQMPNMDGYKAAQVIRAMSDPGRSRIPIIAMTANAFEEDKKDALAAGMNGHLSKPIAIPKLLEALAEVLK